MQGGEGGGGGERCNNLLGWPLAAIVGVVKNFVGFRRVFGVMGESIAV